MNSNKLWLQCHCSAVWYSNKSISKPFNAYNTFLLLRLFSPSYNSKIWPSNCTRLIFLTFKINFIVVESLQNTLYPAFPDINIWCDQGT